MAKLSRSNVVKRKELRDVQLETLRLVKESVCCSKGPYGSFTQLVPKMNQDGNGFISKTVYTKDGKMIEESIRTNRPIENAVIQELKELTNFIVNEVGDGTTGVVELSYYIFKAFAELEEKEHIPSFRLIEEFKNVVNNIIDKIKSNARPLTIDEVRKIAMISTNSNKELTDDIVSIYEEFGLGVNVEIKMSPSATSFTKAYTGITLDEGMAHPVFINYRSDEDNKKNAQDNNTLEFGQCIIRNPRIYVFRDLVNDYDMCKLFMTIIDSNIMNPYLKAQELLRRGQKPEQVNDYLQKNVVPTVIVAPNISRDTNSRFEDYIKFMYQFTDLASKPPLLIVLGLSLDEMAINGDVWDLCGCKPICKYINPEFQKDAEMNGYVATPENVVDKFYGTCEQVVSDSIKTSFVKPSQMMAPDSTPENPKYSDTYTTRVKFYEDKLKQLRSEGDVEQAGAILRRLRTYTGNMVEYYVGGISDLDKNTYYSAAEDAVLNIHSASIHGYGYGANFEGFRAAYERVTKEHPDSDANKLSNKIARIILNAYETAIIDLYMSSGISEEEAKEQMEHSLIAECPYNLVTGKFDGTVLTSIRSDSAILEGISKIISILMTTNQALLPYDSLNTYNAGEAEIITSSTK